MGEKIDPVLFVSKRRELRLIVKPADRTFDEARRPVILRGERVEFVNNRFQTADPHLIAWLKQHPMYNREFTSGEVGAKPEKVVSVVDGIRTVSDVPPPKNEEDLKEVHTLGPERQETPISKEEVEHMMDQKLDSFLEKVAHMMQSQSEEKDKIVKPKKVFTCPIEGCGMVFKTGIDLGRHKKAMHSA